jgi:hypothetical protein
LVAVIGVDVAASVLGGRNGMRDCKTHFGYNHHPTNDLG